MIKSSTIIHVQFKAGGDYYFGSIAAIYDQFSRIDLGVSRSRLYDFDIDENRPYSNKICTIRKSTLHRKQGNRNGARRVTKKIVTNSCYIK